MGVPVSLGFAGVDWAPLRAHQASAPSKRTPGRRPITGTVAAYALARARPAGFRERADSNQRLEVKPLHRGPHTESGVDRAPHDLHHGAPGIHPRRAPLVSYNTVRLRCARYAASPRAPTISALRNLWRCASRP